MLNRVSYNLKLGHLVKSSLFWSKPYIYIGSTKQDECQHPLVTNFELIIKSLTI